MDHADPWWHQQSWWSVGSWWGFRNVINQTTGYSSGVEEQRDEDRKDRTQKRLDAIHDPNFDDVKGFRDTYRLSDAESQTATEYATTGAQASSFLLGGGAITGYTRHGLNQAIGRDGVGVSSRAILDAVKNPLRVIQQPGGRIKYIGQHAGVVINQGGKIITTWPRGAGGFRGAGGGY